MNVAHCLRMAFRTALVVFFAYPAAAACPDTNNIRKQVSAGTLCLTVATFGAEQAGPSPTLIVVVHGDASAGGPADYLFKFARSFAKPGIVSVAIIRPGYSTRRGRTSEGTNNNRSDSYTPANIAAIGDAVETLKRYYKPDRVVYVGHSGGSAIGGVLIGQRPGLIQAAILASCPCDIERWRREGGRRLWTQSESPSSYVDRVPTSTAILAVSGTEDDNTFPALAEDYVARLVHAGVRARFVAIAGKRHGFSGVAAATKAAVEELISR